MAIRRHVYAPLLPLITSLFLLLFAGCSDNTSSAVTTLAATPSPTATRTPAPPGLPAGTVLYQADWSHGINGWQGTSGWRVVQSQLETGSGTQSTVTIPYRPRQANYAIEMRIQIERLTTNDGGYFIIFATRAQDKDGYQAEVSGLRGAAEKRPHGDHPSARVMIDPFGSQAQGTGIPIDFEPGFKWHTYRVEVRDNEARMFVDGVATVRASSDQTDTLSNGPLGLTCEQVILRVSSIRITAL